MTPMRPFRVTPRRPRPRPPDDLAPRRLVLAPLAWLKWQYLCHAGPTEVAGFGLSAAADPAPPRPLAGRAPDWRREYAALVDQHPPLPAAAAAAAVDLHLDPFFTGGLHDLD